MQSRMDRYNNVSSSDNNTGSRTKRNQGLYEKIKTSDIKAYDVNNNMSIIDDNIKSVDINKVHNFLDEKYGDNTAKRRSITLEEINQTQEIDPIMDTKEYDINAILEKAKQGKNIDYSKERLKKVREAQYNILNNIDVEINKLSAVDQAKADRKQQEENLKNLIDTITQIELKNKKKEEEEVDTSSDLDLLSDLMGDEDDEKIGSTDENKLGGKFMSLDTIDITKEIGALPEEIVIPEVEEEKTEETDSIDLTDTTPDIVIGGLQQEENTINNKVVNDQKVIDNNEKKEESTKDKKDEHIEETLSKLNIDLSNYDDFADINEKDQSTATLKIIIFIVFIVLILGGLYILNNLLGLGLFNF